MTDCLLFANVDRSGGTSMLPGLLSHTRELLLSFRPNSSSSIPPYHIASGPMPHDLFFIYLFRQPFCNWISTFVLNLLYKNRIEIQTRHILFLLLVDWLHYCDVCIEHNSSILAFSFNVPINGCDLYGLHHHVWNRDGDKSPKNKNKTSIWTRKKIHPTK